MQLPIVRVKTKDGYILHGFLSEPRKKQDSILIHIHGTAGNFYQSTYYPALFGMASDVGVSMLTTNNRGTGVYDIEEGTKNRGAAIELFEECLIDIDAWIEFAFSLGYKKIILEGHSFGTNKIQYYALHGAHTSALIALILLGFTDSYGGQIEYLKRTGRRNEDILHEAQGLMDLHKPLQLLSDLYINWGELPQSARSYLNFMAPGSELSKILPLRERSLPQFKTITVPMLGIVGDHLEATVISPDKAVDLLNRENKLMNAHSIKDSNHTYVGKEKEMSSIVKVFITKIL